ncbi:MAG: Rpn family recombination-promoting nuclease/putative transposase [Spirochaetaceae bacterium]|jgi:hypothetical protein|nr:Rpn family recombination-promoting nuclease/putative transposase [Spirochaetaceae bacterium]
MGVNIKYKDSVFSWLFGDPDILRELYGAIEGVQLPPDVPVTINTLEGVLYKARMNDISFEIGDKIVVLIEHQSTINKNMPLRLLLYIAKVYEKIIGDKNIYHQRRILLPLPEFIVLYNGTDPYPDESILRLSDSFNDPSELGIAKADCMSLELVVKVYNINKGHNEAILRRCKTLEGYSNFIAKVREYEGKVKTKDEAMKLAVNDCIANDILKDFLKANVSEVINMLLTEWNWDDALAVSREEGREEGLEEGLEKGREEGLEEGLQKGQKTILDLVRQGYTAEQIEAMLASRSSNSLSL